MKNVESWKPTKAERYGARWRASRDRGEVSLGSRAMADWVIEAYENAIRAHACGVLADIGCGKMPYYGIYRGFVSEVIGVDWPSSLHENPHLDVLCDLNERIDLPDETVDTVLCTDVLEHIYRPARLWQEMARVLRPEGKAIVAVPFLYWIHEAPHDYHRYTGFALERYATEGGLRVDSLVPIGGLPHVLTDMMCKATQRVGLISEGVRLGARALLSIGPVGRAAAASASRFPLAYVMIVSKPAAGGGQRDAD
jgi:SAM-dependent methyltransferase